MSRKLFIFSAIAFVLLTNAFAAYFDSGITTFHQGPPYTAVFSGRYWGDEFESWYRTADGYTFVIVNSNSEGYFYFATLDSNGEFAPSNSLVGIDSPLPGAYLLDRSPSRKAQIEAQRQEFLEGCRNLLQSHKSRLDSDKST